MKHCNMPRVAGLAAALFLTACGGGSEPTEQAATGSTTTPLSTSAQAVTGAGAIPVANPTSVQTGGTTEDTTDTVIAPTARGVLSRAQIEAQDWTGRMAELAALVKSESDADVLAGVTHAATNARYSEAEREAFDTAFIAALDNRSDDAVAAVAAEYFGTRGAGSVVRMLTSPRGMSLPDRLWSLIAFTLRRA